MTIREPKFEMKKPTEFRQLVENLVKDSDLFEDWINPEDPDEKMSVLDAIENNKLSLYTEKDDRRAQATRCLVAIYKELNKPNPDDDFVEKAVDSLKHDL